MKEIKKLLKKGRHGLDRNTINKLIARHHLEAVEPLYTLEDAERATAHFDGHPYRFPTEVGNNVTCTLYDAGHIVGSAIVILRIRENGKLLRVGFTGDIGRFDKPIIKDPTLVFEEEDRHLDLLIMESTYGNRVHEPVADLSTRLKTVLNNAADRGGAILIPCFAFGRTQELIYLLHTLYEEGTVPELPVFVDSPLASNLTRVFGEHPEVYDQDTHATFLQQGRNPFSFDGIRFVASVEESMALNRRPGPHIVLAASGMCEGGRILHHLRHKIHDEKTTILIVGYMAQHTLGRRILEQGLAYAASGRTGDPPMLRFLNKEYPLRAHVETINGFSAHGDRTEMTQFLQRSNLDVERIAVVHGEEDQALAFSEYLEGLGYAVSVPRRGETLWVG
jgi:metallo-beta-lactamase family protein